MPELALRKVERHLEGLGVAYTILRPNLYMQNFCSGFMLESIRARGAFELCAGNGKVSFVDERDVAAVAAAALLDDAHDGQAYTLTGSESLLLDEAAAILSEAAGRRIQYRAVQPDRMLQLLSDARWPMRQATVGAALFESVAAGRREPVRDDLRLVLGRPPITFEDFAREHAEVWR
jgi:uncharacterized protein YbjT (DUF2867 family)